MKQNNIKQLILSIRKSRHNMFKKIETFVQAIWDKGSVDMDTHELSNLVKDTFTKRRAKTFYADVLSSVIGEPEQPAAKEAPTFVAMSYNIDSGQALASTYKLGDPITIQNGTINPYVIFLTEEQKNNIFISVVDAGDLSNENINAMYRIVNIANEGSLSGDLDGYVDTNVYKYMMYVSYLPFQGNPGAEYAANKVTITYDGVDYVYQS